MKRVILMENGITRVIENNSILKEHFTTPSDRAFYTNQGLRVDDRREVRAKRKGKRVA